GGQGGHADGMGAALRQRWRVGAQQIDAVVQGGILPTSVSRLWRGQPQGASPPDHADRRAAFP
ncbi:hypothetical protein, partial [uncultured Sulfitobacter sp.]|uniref:hypothetical protein n=1 Tax=uncultured Sulfitobacter sp. TaxID=191468 RepID=UPI0025953D5B